MKKYEALRSAFKERVLPDYPNIKRRFSRYFEPSYRLIESSKDKICPPLAFTLLGLKPLSFIEFKGSHIILGRLLLSAGLHIRKDPGRHCNNIIEVFDPELAAEPLSRLLNKQISPEQVSNSIKEIHGSYGNELLGYPQKTDAASFLSSIYRSSLNLKVASSFQEKPGGIDQNMVFMRAEIKEEHSLAKMLPALASAAAIIEDIKESSVKLVTSASLSINKILLNTWKKEIDSEYTRIKRTGIPADWRIDQKTCD